MPQFSKVQIASYVIALCCMGFAPAIADKIIELHAAGYGDMKGTLVVAILLIAISVVYSKMAYIRGYFAARREESHKAYEAGLAVGSGFTNQGDRIK